MKRLLLALPFLALAGSVEILGSPYPAWRLVIIGVGLGVYTAARQYKFADRFFQGLSIVTINTHVVVISILVVALGIWINELTGTRVFYVVGSSSNPGGGFFAGSSTRCSTSSCRRFRW
mgnify:CR=1 FL=1